MLSATAQQAYAYEIPLATGTTPRIGIPTADQLTTPELGQGKFEELDDARRLLTETGVLE
jgi:hypothetical protein